MSSGRNNPCPCGSGKKFKHCCEANVGANPTPADFNQLAILYHGGRFPELENQTRMLLKRYPESGLVWKLLCVALQMQEKDALLPLQKAAELLPGDAEIHNNLGHLFQVLGRPAEAATSCRRALALVPDFIGAHVNLGNALKDLGQLDAAVESYRRALEIDPNIAEIHSNLGAVLHELQRLDAAVASHRRALEINPNYAAAHNNLGNSLKEIGQLDEAVASYRRALTIQPDYAEAFNNLAIALQTLGQFEEAIANYRRALMLQPEFFEAYNNLGHAFKNIGQFEAAISCCRKALEIKPDYADAHNNLGLAIQAAGQFNAAVASYRHAVEVKPDCVDAYNNLGNALKDLGEIDDAIASFRRALEIKPDYALVHSNLLLTLNYRANQPVSACISAASEFGRLVSQRVSQPFSSWRFLSGPGRLRVGMVSGDFRNHPVGYFLEGLLEQVDFSRVELLAYPTHFQTDELTARIKPHFAAWKPLYGLGDEAAARMIYSDGVHVLLDLAGHTAKNRLPLFAWKPAPVQASWLGYFATTGVAEMDYLLADEVSVPEALQSQFTERIWYLPDTRWCFTPPAVDVSVAVPPAFENGYPTFGCFQNLAKVGEEVMRVWARTMAAVPQSRLRWQCRQFDDATVTAQCLERLRQHGIDTARVTLHGKQSRRDYLLAHNEVDFILDTFPFAGGTTTCEALWMGVPTLSLAGDTLVARQGASILAAAGLPEWVAASENEYVEKAANFARDLPRLAQLRAELRARVLASPLYDAPRFARNFEVALWGMWQQWQARQ